MSTKIRLKRIGGKKKPYYRVVVADSRSPRDGKFIEEIGSYDPNRDAGIKINEEKALYWLDTGACPSETVKSILKRAGIWQKHTELRKAK